MNRLQHTPTLFPPVRETSLATTAFCLLTQARGCWKGIQWATERVRTWAPSMGLLWPQYNDWNKEIYIICKHWLWLLFGRYKLSNSLWIQSLWSSGMWHDEVWHTCTGLRGTFCLHLQGNVGGTHVPNYSDKSSEDKMLLL